MSRHDIGFVVPRCSSHMTTTMTHPLLFRKRYREQNWELNIRSVRRKYMLGYPTETVMTRLNFLVPTTRKRCIFFKIPTEHFKPDTDGISLWFCSQKEKNSDKGFRSNICRQPFTDLEGNQFWINCHTKWSSTWVIYCFKLFNRCMAFVEEQIWKLLLGCSTYTIMIHMIQHFPENDMEIKMGNLTLKSAKRKWANELLPLNFIMSNCILKPIY